MTSNKGHPVRKFFTRMMATGALLAIYGFSTIATTGIVLVTGTSAAHAQRGRGRGGGGAPARGRGRGGGGGRGIGAGIAAGVAIGVIGGAIAADQARRRAREDDGVEYCMRTFRSYNPDTGTYIGRDGRERACP